MASRGDSGKAVRPPATTPQARENQLIAAAYDLAEQQIREGRASAQVITHFLKLGTARETLERRKLEGETKLLDAKVEDIATRAQSEEIYQKALEAMRSYAGSARPDEILE